MTVSDWFAAALLLILSALTVGIFIHVALIIWQLCRDPEKKQKAKPPQPILSSTLFETSSPLVKGKPTLDDTQTFWDHLTKRETQVARLAARGLTDAAIAEKLSISERTVGNHLYSIYRKLNINSRRELKYVLEQIEDDP